MTDAQSLAFQDYSQTSEPRHRPIARQSPAIQPPKLRGWRLDPANRMELLKQELRQRAARRALDTLYWEFPEYRFKEQPAKESKQKREDAAALRKEFQKHAEKWRSETKFLSSIHQITLHPSYLRIIGMGSPALPFIFEELEKKSGHWFSALHAITGADPVPTEDQGRIKKMVQHWLEWGKAQTLY
jgi:hypothetical protein